MAESSLGGSGLVEAGLLVMAVVCGAMLVATLCSLWVSLTDRVLVPSLLGAKNFEVQGWVLCIDLFLSRFKVWDMGEVSTLSFGGSTTLVFQDSDYIASGALLKFNVCHIWLFDLSPFNFLFKNTHDQLCKFIL